jgi:hypothetical protein
MILNLDNRDIDLSKAFPLTLGDLRKLGKAGLIGKSGEIDTNGPDAIVLLLFHIANKALPKDSEPITEEHIEEIELSALAEITEYFTHMASGKEEEVDRPT